MVRFHAAPPSRAFVPFALALVTAAAALAEPALAQRGGGRGRSEAILARVGCFFVDAKLPAAADGGDVQLAACENVKAASASNLPSVLYLFDSGNEAAKLEQFERTMFRNDELGIAMRTFHCARADLRPHAAALAKFGKRAPLFVVFDKDGKQAAEVACDGFKATAGPLVKALEKAAGPLVKPSHAGFVKSYRSLVNDLEVLEGRRKVLQDRQARAAKDGDAGKAKLAELEKEAKELDAEQAKLEAREKELLEKANAPARAEGAQRLGGQSGGDRGGERGGERGGDRGGERGGDRGGR